MVLGYFFSMFPARAGVVPDVVLLQEVPADVPRASGGGPFI